MRALYRQGYSERFKEIAKLIEPKSSVLDVCCGPGILYRHYLSKSDVSYTGLDLNPTFISRVRSYGVVGMVTDIRNLDSFPSVDFVIMQSSLYHFLPDPVPVLTKMFEAAKKALIIAEPISNITSINFLPLKNLAARLSDPGTGSQGLRFTESALDALLIGMFPGPIRSFRIGGGREKIYVFSRRESEM